MVTWNDYLVKQEQYRDQLRQAEQWRLVRCMQTGARSRLGSLVLNLVKGQPARGEMPCEGWTQLVEKAA